MFCEYLLLFCRTRFNSNFSLPWSQEALGLIIWFLVLYKSGLGGTFSNPWWKQEDRKFKDSLIFGSIISLMLAWAVWDPTFKKWKCDSLFTLSWGREAKCKSRDEWKHGGTQRRDDRIFKEDRNGKGQISSTVCKYFKVKLMWHFWYVRCRIIITTKK